MDRTCCGTSAAVARPEARRALGGHGLPKLFEGEPTEVGFAAHGSGDVTVRFSQLKLLHIESDRATFETLGGNP